MDLILHRCADCGKHRGGKLFKFEGRWYCNSHFRDRLNWHESRSNLRAALITGMFGVSVVEVRKPPDVAVLYTLIRRFCDRAGFALKYNRPRDFVRAFTDALWVWEQLK